MPQILLVEYKPEFFKIKKTFYDINRIFRKNLLSNYINYSFIEVSDDTHLLKDIYKLLNIPENSLLDVTTTTYGEDTIIQAIYHETVPNKFVLFKRNLNNDQDTYSFSEFKENENIYTLIDLTLNDLEKFIRSKFIASGIWIDNDNKLQEYEYIIEQKEDGTGILYLKSDNESKEIIFHNMLSDVRLENEDKITRTNTDENILEDLYKKKNVTHILSYKDLGTEESVIGTLIFFSEMVTDKEINNRMSHFFNIQLYGPLFLTLAENNTTSKKHLDLSISFYEKMEKAKILNDSIGHLRINPYIANPYRELKKY